MQSSKTEIVLYSTLHIGVRDLCVGFKDALPSFFVEETSVNI